MLVRTKNVGATSSLRCTRPKLLVLPREILGGGPAPSKSSEEALKEFKAHARFGDYAGRIYNDLKEIGLLIAPLNRGDAAVMDRLLKDEKTPSKVIESFQAACKLVCSASKTLDEASVRYAIERYAVRNLAFHGVLRDLNEKGDPSVLRKHIERDLLSLPDILPADQLPQLENGVKLSNSTRNVHQ